MEEKAIRVVNLHKSFGTQKVLNGINLEIEKGETTVIIGKSGGGKSVLLKHLIGLIKPDEGEIWIHGVDITRLREKDLNEIRMSFGMLFQEAALFDSMDVFDNVAFPLREHTKKSEKEIEIIVEDKLKQVGLLRFKDKMPAELSGGMRKRVGLARALALDPETILFDEPTSALDPIISLTILDLIKETQTRLHKTYVVISHDILGMFRIADKVALLSDGKIIEQGTPGEIRKSRNEAAMEFLNATKLPFFTGGEL
ncbi:MAG TPA: ABC transporter ATP-binding protein [Syntrophorhabdus sp.]|mgnify:FL=1|jgi:phospholipid/cholesterol/gamma-HCH transport system ATP-binding protein|nr:ABC transporter ATP-binding protein [Syntrophorhabdus sp.]HQP56659.1 ABC transporter ATP-binding protein [Syntrophorhabdus sp.]